MFQFLCKVRGHKLVATDSNKQELLDNVFSDVETNDILVKVSIEYVKKDINKAQEALYNAYILSAAEFFGTDFHNMQDTLKKFFPVDVHGDPKPVIKWNNTELSDFLNQSGAHMAEFGFHFKKKD